jgi:hypothetical protein
MFRLSLGAAAVIAVGSLLALFAGTLEAKFRAGQTLEVRITVPDKLNCGAGTRDPQLQLKWFIDHADTLDVHIQVLGPDGNAVFEVEREGVSGNARDVLEGGINAGTHRLRATVQSAEGEEGIMEATFDVPADACKASNKLFVGNLDWGSE